MQYELKYLIGLSCKVAQSEWPTWLGDHSKQHWYRARREGVSEYFWRKIFLQHAVWKKKKNLNIIGKKVKCLSQTELCRVKKHYNGCRISHSFPLCDKKLVRRGVRGYVLYAFLSVLVSSGTYKYGTFSSQISCICYIKPSSIFSIRPKVKLDNCSS